MQGEPRSTHDIDLVVALTEAAAAKLVKAFPAPAFYLAEEAIRDAVRRQSMFNLLSLDEGEKVDFWLLTEGPFDQSRFARKRVALRSCGTAASASLHACKAASQSPLASSARASSILRAARSSASRDWPGP